MGTNLLSLAVALGLALSFAGPATGQPHPGHESQAKLLFRLAGLPGVPTEDPHRTRAGFLETEKAILESWDLARTVAGAIGTDSVVPGRGEGPESLRMAAEVIQTGLTVEIQPETSMLNLTFRSADPKLPQRVLQEVIECYFARHIEIHQPTPGLADLAQRVETQRIALRHLTRELKKLRDDPAIDPDVVGAMKIRRQQEKKLLHSLRAALEQAEAQVATSQSEPPHLAVIQTPTPVKQQLAQ